MDAMAWLAWIIVGALVGWLASIVMESHEHNSDVLDMLIGGVGGAIGGAMFSFLGTPGAASFNAWSLFVAFIGAVFLLGLVRVVAGSEPSY